MIIVTDLKLASPMLTTPRLPSNTARNYNHTNEDDPRMLGGMLPILTTRCFSAIYMCMYFMYILFVINCFDSTIKL